MCHISGPVVLPTTGMGVVSGEVNKLRDEIHAHTHTQFIVTCLKNVCQLLVSPARINILKNCFLKIILVKYVLIQSYA